MKTRTISLQNFGGGLNTSIDEALVPPNMSPNIINADVLEVDAIKSRNGYRVVAEPGVEGVLAENNNEDGTLTLTSEIVDFRDSVILFDQSFIPSGGTITAVEYKMNVTASPWSLNPTKHWTTVWLMKDGGPIAQWESQTIPVGTHKLLLPSSHEVDPAGNYSLSSEFLALDDTTGFTLGLAFSNGDYADGELTQTYGTGVSAGDDLKFKVYGISAVQQVTALKRYYRMAGANLWVARLNDKMLLRQEGVKEVPQTVLEAENASVTGTTSSHTPRFGYTPSGGQVSRITGSAATYQIPYCSLLKVHGGLRGVLLSLDGASDVIAGGDTHNFGAITATSHTLRVKPPVRNSTTLRMRPTGVGKTRIRHRPIPNIPLPNSYSLYRVTVSAYDRGYDNTDQMLRVWDTDSGNHAQVGIYTPASKTHYNFGGHFGQIPGIKKRATGWRQFSFSVRLDRGSGAGGTVTVSRPAVDGTITSRNIQWEVKDFSDLRLELFSRVFSTGVISFFWDTYRENGSLIDDFGTLSGWTGDGTSTTYGDDIIDESTKPWTGQTDSYADVDYFTYSALGDFTEIGSITASADTVGMAVMNDKLYYGSALDDLHYTVGASGVTVTGSGTTKPAFLVEHRRRLFAAGKATDRSILEYTAVDNGENWTGGGSLRPAGKDSGAECTGLVVWDNLLFYFAPTRVYAIDTSAEVTSDWEFKVLHNRYGCIAPRSLADSATGVIFLADDGVRAYGYIPNVMSDDGSGILLLSKHINPTIESILNKGNAAGTIFKGRYWLSCELPDVEGVPGVNNAILVCDLEKRVRVEGDNTDQPVWTRYDIRGVTCFETTRGDEYGLYAGTYNGGIIQLDTGDTDAGQTIDMTYQIPELPVKGSETVKHFRHLHIAAKAELGRSLHITPITDDVPGQSIDVPLTPGTISRPERCILAARGRYIKALIETRGANQPVTLSGVTFTYRPSPRMR